MDLLVGGVISASWLLSAIVLAFAKRAENSGEHHKVRARSILAMSFPVLAVIFGLIVLLMMDRSP